MRAGAYGRVGDYLDRFFGDDIAHPALDDFHFVVAERKPVWYRGSAFMRHRSEMTELERVFVPLAADGAVVDIIMCLSVFFGSNGREL